MKYINDIQIIKFRMSVQEEKAISSPENVAEIVRKKIQGDEREYFFCLLLNNKNKIKDIQVISIGTISESIVHPREVFRAAIVTGASSIILAHNHPSGDLKPSTEDIKTTERLKEAGKLLGIQLLDHVIVTEDEFLSMKQAGYLE